MVVSFRRKFAGSIATVSKEVKGIEEIRLRPAEQCLSEGAAEVRLLLLCVTLDREARLIQNLIVQGGGREKVRQIVGRDKPLGV